MQIKKFSVRISLTVVVEWNYALFVHEKYSFDKGYVYIVRIVNSPNFIDSDLSASTVQS